MKTSISYRIITALAVIVFCFAGSVQQANAYTYFIDLVPGTVPLGAPTGGGTASVSGLPPTGGVPDFIESSVFVTSGTAVTAIVYVAVDPGSGAPFGWNEVGIELNWGGTAMLAPTGPALAGSIAGTTAGVGDLFGGPVVPGAPLAIAPYLPVAFPPGPLKGNLGGIAMTDLTGTGFGGLGVGGLPAFDIIDIFGITFMATGLPGDSVLIDPMGVFAPGGFFPPAGGPPGAFGGLADLGGLFGPVGTVPDIGGIPATITIIPEPGVGVLFGLVGVCALLRRRRR